VAFGITRRRARGDSERGAVMIQAAVTMVVLLGFAAFVVDYGVLWLSRDQAQLAADAGALAGAVSLAYDGGSADVAAAATTFVGSNPVWFAAATTEVFSETCPPPNSLGANCVRVKVYRDGTVGSTALPTIFGPILGVTSQGVQASATAQVAAGNDTPCLKPWAIPDRWIEHRPVDKPWEPGDDFERYDAAGALLPTRDEYTPPNESDPGTGLSVADNLGDPVTLTFSFPSASDPITPGLLLPLVLDGTNSYDENIVGCNGQSNALGAGIATDLTATEVATTDGLTTLFNADAGAAWNAGDNRIEGSCAPSCAPISPRLVALAVFDVDQYQLMRATGTWGCTGGISIECVNVVNIVGFFIESVTSSGATGYITKYPGQISPSNPFVIANSSFLPAVTLVR
jgi:Flp pilus assembly protein TadG